MPRRVGYGRPDTTVFPPSWGATNGRVFDNTLDSTITIAPAAGTAGWDAGTGRTRTTPAAAVYDGPASLIPDNEATPERVVAEDPVPVRTYEVKLQHEAAGIRVGMVITVTASPDLALLEQTLTVTGVEYDARRFARIVSATLNHTR